MNNECKSVGRWISILYRYGQMNMSREFKKFNIGGGQYIFLLRLYVEDGLSQEQLSSKLNIDKGTTARAVKKLEQEGYVVKKQDEKDKRSYKIYLTEKARIIKPELFNVLKNWTEALTKGFNADEKELSLNVLERMCNNACSYVKGDVENE